MAISAVDIVVILFVGALIIFIVTVLIKRQVRRVTLPVFKAPLAAIGSKASKTLRELIKMRIDSIGNFRIEPNLVIGEYVNGHQEFISRMKIIDDHKLIERELFLLNENHLRTPEMSVRRFLISLREGALKEVPEEVIHKYSDIYENARHDPMFNNGDDFRDFAVIHSHLISKIRKNRPLQPMQTDEPDKPRRWKLFARRGKGNQTNSSATETENEETPESHPLAGVRSSEGRSTFTSLRRSDSLSSSDGDIELHERKHLLVKDPALRLTSESLTSSELAV